jgi:hypothetical protein
VGLVVGFGVSDGFVGGELAAAGSVPGSELRI